jgi:hypothetical protein
MVKAAKKIGLNHDNAATWIGIAIAVLNAWQNVDWENFEWDKKHIAPLLISAGIAIIGKLSTIKKKENGPENKDI